MNRNWITCCVEELNVTGNIHLDIWHDGDGFETCWTMSNHYRNPDRMYPQPTHQLKPQLTQLSFWTYSENTSTPYWCCSPLKPPCWGGNARKSVTLEPRLLAAPNPRERPPQTHSHTDSDSFSLTPPLTLPPSHSPPLFHSLFLSPRGGRELGALGIFKHF